MPCKYCSSDLTYEKLVQPEENIIHYSRILCADCGTFLGWGKKPDSKNRPANHSDLIRKYKKEYCPICMRPSSKLVMEAHHIVEFQHGGTSDEDNILVLCYACHKIVHHIRNYCPKETI